MSDSPSVLKTLQAATKGLRWPSESDKPVKAFQWSADTVKDAKADEAVLRGNAKLADGATVKPVPFDEFFAPVTQMQDWFGDDEKATAEHFKDLKDTLAKELTDVAAFRVEGNHPDDTSIVDAYVLGKTSDGGIAGVATQLIET